MYVQYFFLPRRRGFIECHLGVTYLQKLSIGHVTSSGRGRDSDAVAVNDANTFKAAWAALSLAICLPLPVPTPFTSPSTAFGEVTLALTVTNEGGSY